MKKTLLLPVAVLLAAPFAASAVEDITVDNMVRLNKVHVAGLGASYKGTFAVDADALKHGEAFIIKTDDVVTGEDMLGDEIIKVPQNKSMGWQDTATNPDIKACSDTLKTECLNMADVATKGFGWAHNADWYLIDLNAIAGQKAYVHVMVERHNDGVATEPDPKDATKTLPSDDDLIPGVTLWQGYQNSGKHIHWFPNRHQATAKWDGSTGTPFWARKLSKPSVKAGKTVYELKGTNSGQVGYDTAYGAGSQDTAVVEGVWQTAKKAGAQQNYLTLALGGDARHADAKSKHAVNYKLTVIVSKKPIMSHH